MNDQSDTWHGQQSTVVSEIEPETRSVSVMNAFYRDSLSRRQALWVIVVTLTEMAPRNWSTG